MACAGTLGQSWRAAGQDRLGGGGADGVPPTPVTTMRASAIASPCKGDGDAEPDDGVVAVATRELQPGVPSASAQPSGTRSR